MWKNQIQEEGWLNEANQSLELPAVQYTALASGICVKCQCKDCEQVISILQRKIQELCQNLSSLQKRNQQLEYLGTFKAMGIKKREDMMVKLSQRFKQETEKTQEQAKRIEKMKSVSEDQQEFNNQLLNQVEFHVNGSTYQQHQLTFRINSKITSRRLESVLGEANTKRFIAKSLNKIHNKNYENEKAKGSELETLEDFMRTKQQTQQQSLQQFKQSTQLGSYSNKLNTLNNNISILTINDKTQKQQQITRKGQKQQNQDIQRGRTKTVSDTQGSHNEASFFKDKIGKFSFFQISNQEKQSVLERLEVLEELFLDETDFTMKLNEMNPLQQREIGVYIKYLIKDLKHFINIGWRLKQLLTITTEMIRQTDLLQAYQSIIELTCNYLKCDRVSIFILDKGKKILWTKGQKSTQMIEIPIDKGIVGHAVVNDIKINVVDAYKDERFNQEIDRQTGYRTKSILVITIKEERGQVAGAIQAINKEEGSFTTDDEEMLDIIAQFSGGIIKNSLLLEDSILKNQRLKKLLNLAMHLYQFEKIEDVIRFAQSQICDMMAVSRCLIGLISKNKERYLLKKYQFRVDNKGISQPITDYITITENNSILSKAVYERELLYIKAPGLNQYYNPQLDIETHLSLITIPVKSLKDDQVIAIIQVEAIKGFVSSVLGTFKEEDLELIKLFANTIGYFIDVKFQREGIFQKSQN